MKRLGFVLIVMLVTASVIVAGCGGGEEPSPTATATPGATATATPAASPTPTPAATLAANATATPAATLAATPTAAPAGTPSPTEPVSSNDLIPFLPGPPSGWEADDAFGMTQTFGEWSWSQASRRYTNTATDESVDVFIFDSAYYYGFGWWLTWEDAYEYESTEGYARSITFEGYPAWKLYDEPDSYILTVFVADRFMVMVSAETEASLNQFADLVDYGAIAGLG
jgi:hypothetical protein